MNTNEMWLSAPVERDSSLQTRLDEARKSLGYQTEYAKQTFSDDLWQAMEHRQLNQVEFASKSGVTKQFLTKVFRGENCTIGTMVRLAFALDYKISIHLTPKEVGCAWLHCTADVSPRPPEQFANLWTESGYRNMVLNFDPKNEKVAA